MDPGPILRHGPAQRRGTALLRALVLALALTLLVSRAPADDPVEALAEAYVRQQVLPWTSDPVLLAAIRAANTAHAGLGQAEIDAADKDWRAQVGAASRPLIDAVLSSPASAALRARIQAAGGTITELIVMDARGLNVAISGVTSDYWQGDEPKFLETFAKGAGALHVEPVDLDESTQIYQAPVSITLSDPATGQPIGAMTIALDAKML